jgi:hypothetical protein
MPKIEKCLNCGSKNIKLVDYDNTEKYGYEYICLDCGEISTNLYKPKPKIKVTLF